MYGVPTVGTTVTDVIARIQYGRITIILNEINETNAEKEDSLIRLYQITQQMEITLQQTVY